MFSVYIYFLISDIRPLTSAFSSLCRPPSSAYPVKQPKGPLLQTGVSPGSSGFKFIIRCWTFDVGRSYLVFDFGHPTADLLLSRPCAVLRPLPALSMSKGLKYP